MQTTSTNPERQQQDKLYRAATNLWRSERSHRYYFITEVAGRTIKKSLKTTDRKTAERLMEDKRRMLPVKQSELERHIPFAVIQTEDEKGERVPTEKQLVGGLARLWADKESVGKSERTQNGYVDRIRHLSKHFPKTVRAITSTDCERWAIARCKELEARTFNMETEILKSIFGYAIRKGLILDNPAKDIERMKVKHKEVVVPTKTQFANLIEHLRKDKRSYETSNLTEFMAYSGARVGEALASQWGDFNFESGTALIRGTKNKKQRTIKLFDPLKRLIIRMQSEQPVPPKRDDRIFTIQSGKKSIRSVCVTLGFPLFHHHTFRHFFATNSIEAGVDFATIAAWLGHSDGGALVAKVYGHFRNEHGENMAKRITFTVAAPRPVDSTSN